MNTGTSLVSAEENSVGFLYIQNFAIIYDLLVKRELFFVFTMSSYLNENAF